MQAVANKAIAKEHAGDLESAFALYTEAAKSHIYLARVAPSSSAREKASAVSDKLLGRAERIKAVRRELRPAPRNVLDQGKLERLQLCIIIICFLSAC
jgi:calpain-7